MERALIAALALAVVLFSGCTGTGSRTCSDGSFVVGVSACPMGETFEIEILSYEGYDFEDIDGRITGKLKIEYNVLKEQEWERLAVYPLDHEEAREFPVCVSAGHCTEVIDWYYFRFGQYEEAGGGHNYRAPFRFCRYDDNDEVGDFGICRDFVVTGFIQE